MASDKDDDWSYLSEILENSNNDDDLVDNNEQSQKTPKTALEAQIHNLTEPNTSLTAISQMKLGKVHIHAKFTRVTGRYIRTGLHITEAIASDDTGSVRVVWFNQPYKSSYIKSDIVYELRGTYNFYRARFQINNAQIRPLSEGCEPFTKEKIKK